MPKKKSHEWVRGRTGFFSGVTLYFERCKNCGVQLAVPKKEWEALPTAESLGTKERTKP